MHYTYFIGAVEPDDAGGERLVRTLTILVGTMTGTAELVADEVRDALAPAGVAAEVVMMDGQGPEVFRRPGPFLICSSTYGQGDVPDNAQALYGALGTQRPDLGHVVYGVIALGDRTYVQTFCNGGRRFDAILKELGARRVGEILFHDASAGTFPEEVAVAWVRDWIGVLSEALAKADA
jgi:MioC protein